MVSEAWQNLKCLSDVAGQQDLEEVAGTPPSGVDYGCSCLRSGFVPRPALSSCTSDLLQGEAPGRSVLGSQVTQPPEKREISFFISIRFVAFCCSSRD